MHHVVAIDGPSGSGKSTLARNLAQELNFIHVDSGSMYRAVAWKAIREDVDVHDGEAMARLVSGVKMEFSVRTGTVVFTIDGVQPGDALRTAAVNDRVSPVAAVPEVRERVTAWLRSMRELGDIVMEGRDIGTVVFPDAIGKFYLVCDPAERAQRRHGQYAELDEGLSVDDVKESLVNRDLIDSGRKTAPLCKADDAVAIDNSDLESGETLALALAELPSDLFE